MTRLVWGELPPIYDYGVDRGALYLKNTGVAWNGLVAVDEKAVGETDSEFYFDGQRRLILTDLGDFAASVSAYTYPDAFAEYNGYSPEEIYQRFGFCYRTQRGEGYELHLVYNVLVRDTSRTWVTETNRPMPSTFDWDIYGATLPVPGARPSAHLTVSSESDAIVLAELEDILYGTVGVNPRLPKPAEVLDLFEDHTVLRITNNRDGTWTASGPDDMVRILPDGRFEIDSPSAIFVNPDVFVVDSY